MPRPEKVQAVAEIRARIDGARAVFLAEYAGLSVKEQQTLRRELRSNEAEFKVVKMTLARRAAAELDLETLDDILLGPTGLAFADGDPTGVAKTLEDFAKAHDVFTIKGGLLGREYLSPERISQLAALEPREVLLAKIAGAMKAPMVKAASLFTVMPRNAASVFQQLLEQKEAQQPVADEVPPPADDSTESEDEAKTEDTAEGVTEEATTEEAKTEDAAEGVTDEATTEPDDDAAGEVEEDN